MSQLEAQIDEPLHTVDRHNMPSLHHRTETPRERRVTRPQVPLAEGEHQVDLGAPDILLQSEPKASYIHTERLGPTLYCRE